MKILAMLCVLSACTAAPQDLTGKMFTFPRSDTTSYVRLFPSSTHFGAVTLCQRFLTDLKRHYSRFSLSTKTIANGFMLLWDYNYMQLQVYIKDVVPKFNLEMTRNTWHSLCVTWESGSGLTQVWLDGVQSARRSGFSGAAFNENLIVMLGQEQDSYGGSFDLNQSYVGMMSDMHMWDRVLKPCEIQAYLNDNFAPGNVINWKELNFQIFDRVVIEEKSVSSC